MKNRDRAAMEKMAVYAKELLSYVNGMDYSAFSNDNKTINACAFTSAQDENFS
jgi:uncharacterized protein with HEPN domain